MFHIGYLLILIIANYAKLMSIFAHSNNKSGAAIIAVVLAVI